MTGPDDRARRDLLADLVELRRAPTMAAAAVRGLPWDSDGELVTLVRANAIGLLQRYIRGELTPSDLEMWADAVEARDDIGLEQGQEDVLRAFVLRPPTRR